MTILPGIDLGSGEHGERRLAALRQMATNQGHTWGGDASVGKLICSIADAQLFYAVASDNLNEQDSITKIIFLKSPGYKNMSREICIKGWLGTTDGIDRSALGMFDASGARALLVEHSVKIPALVPVQHGVGYLVGGSDRAENVNKQNAYAYSGDWANVPDWAARHCYRPARALTYRIVDRSEGDEWPLFIVEISDGESWYKAPGHETSREDAEWYGQSLQGGLFDAGRMGRV